MTFVQDGLTFHEWRFITGYVIAAIAITLAIYSIVLFSRSQGHSSTSTAMSSAFIALALGAYSAGSGVGLSTGMAESQSIRDENDILKTSDLFNENRLQTLEDSLSAALEVLYGEILVADTVLYKDEFLYIPQYSGLIGLTVERISRDTHIGPVATLRVIRYGKSNNQQLGFNLTNRVVEFVVRQDTLLAIMSDIDVTDKDTAKHYVRVSIVRKTFTD